MNLTLDVRQEDDAFEPNNERADAAEISLNEDVNAQFWIPYVSNSEKSPDDWYKVDLEEGEATFKLTQVPENLRFSIRVQGPTFSNVGNTNTPNAGALHEWKFDVKDAGTHYFQVEPHFPNDLGPDFWNKTPKSLTEQYTFQIQQ